MRCPVCGQNAINKEGQAYCPSCKIFLGNYSEAASIRHVQPETQAPGITFQKRARKNFIVTAIISLFIVGLVLSGLGFVVLNYTAIGYREKVFYRYAFTREASSKLRGMRIEVANVFESKPLGLQHSGYWKPNTQSVRLNTANDEVAIHEFAHAWWEDLRKDEETKKGLINDTIKLSQMEDSTYNQTAKRAQWIVSEFCPCPDTSNINYKAVDDHHFYAYMADFTMGQYKEGSHQLPEFMWKYFDGLFSGNLRVTPCYEIQSCHFPGNNDAAELIN